METYLLLDSGSRSYQGLILLYHNHNHPVMRVFAWLVQAGVAIERSHSIAFFFLFLASPSGDLIQSLSMDDLDAIR